MPRLGLSRHVADTLPADKAEYVQQLRREGRIVAMVGDGINDSPALSFADVGIAMKHGAQVAHESANIVLMEDNLWKLVKAIEISRERRGADQTELQNRRHHEYDCAGAGAARRPDHTATDRRAQQWVGDRRQPERHAADVALLMMRY
jgi:hypothetical protein